MKDRKILLQKYTNEHSRFLNVNGSLIHYRDEGEGEPILLLHGACSSLHTFDDWTEVLKKNYRVIRMDLPGSGLSDAPEWASNAANDTYLNYVLQFLEVLKVKSCTIAGNSLGGWLAWELALNRPKLVDRLILISSAGFIDATAIPSIFLFGQVPLLNKMGKFVITRPMMQRQMEEVFVHPNLVTPELVDRYYDLFSQKKNTESFLFWLGGKFKDHTKRLSKIKQPTLIIWGEQDSWIKVNNAYRFNSAIENSELVLYEDLGHVPQEEAPQITVEDIMEFMEKHAEGENILKKVA